MFVIFLQFSDNKAAAPEHMAGHNAWITQGFSDGIFQCAGSLVPFGGGALLAVGESHVQLEKRIQLDPFVQNNVVSAEITEIDVKKTVPVLDFLKVEG